MAPHPKWPTRTSYDMVYEHSYFLVVNDRNMKWKRNWNLTLLLAKFSENICYSARLIFQIMLHLSKNIWKNRHNKAFFITSDDPCNWFSYHFLKPLSRIMSKEQVHKSSHLFKSTSLMNAYLELHEQPLWTEIVDMLEMVHVSLNKHLPG